MTDPSGYAKKSIANGDTGSSLRLRLRFAVVPLPPEVQDWLAAIENGTPVFRDMKHARAWQRSPRVRFRPELYREGLECPASPGTR